jgi:anti-anti-sigma factor
VGTVCRAIPNRSCREQREGSAMTEGVLRIIRRGSNGTAETLDVAGELDIETGPILEDAVNRTLDGQRGEFHLDLRGLTFMDAGGVRALLRVQNRVESLERRLVLISPTPLVGRVLEILRLDQVIDVRQ